MQCLLANPSNTECGFPTQQACGIQEQMVFRGAASRNSSFNLLCGNSEQQKT